MPEGLQKQGNNTLVVNLELIEKEFNIYSRNSLIRIPWFGTFYNLTPTAFIFYRSDGVQKTSYLRQLDSESF